MIEKFIGGKESILIIFHLYDADGDETTASHIRRKPSADNQRNVNY